jgi:hypothetical protein
MPPVPALPWTDAQDQSVSAVFTQAQNISSVWIDLFDVTATYDFQTDNWGSFSTTAQTTYYKAYDYQDLFGGRKEAVGLQNAGTGIVPPMPKFKSNVRLNWFMDNQSASLSANYWHTVKYDDVTVDAYNDGWVAPAHCARRTALRRSLLDRAGSVLRQRVQPERGHQQPVRPAPPAHADAGWLRDPSVYTVGPPVLGIH